MNYQLISTKIKIMCFRNKERRNKNNDWYLNKQKIEKVNNIKYLGYLFNENNNHNNHKGTQIKKCERIIYTTWSLIKMAKGSGIYIRKYTYSSL